MFANVFALSAFALALGVVAQTTPPECALTCATQTLPNTDCGSITNITCLCTDPSFFNLTGTCAVQNCSSTDQAIAQTYFGSLCSGISSAISSASAVASGTSNASASAATSTRPASASAAATSAASAAATSAGTSGAKALLASYPAGAALLVSLVGVMVGAGAVGM